MEEKTSRLPEPASCGLGADRPPTAGGNRSETQVGERSSFVFLSV